jgi:cell division protein FtsQ
VHVKQKQAVARVLAPTKHFYLDAEGHPYPTTVNFSAYVPTISGRTDSASIYHAYSVLQEIYAMPYFKNWLAEIHTTTAGNIQLIPATGNHRVLFGSAANAAEKLKMLEAFYTTVVTPENLNDWKTLNVAYQGQLVTTKYSM